MFAWNAYWRVMVSFFSNLYLPYLVSTVSTVPDQDCSSSFYLPYSSGCAWRVCLLPSSVSCCTGRTAAVWARLSTIPPLLKDQKSIKDKFVNLACDSRCSSIFAIYFRPALWSQSQKPVPTQRYLDIETENQGVTMNIIPSSSRLLLSTLLVGLHESFGKRFRLIVPAI